MHEPEPLPDTPRLSSAQLETFDDDSAPPATPATPPVREGLPPGFRMRADKHYVEELDTRMSSIPVRLIDTQSIESGDQQGDALTPAFIDCVRQLGVLQPLLVMALGSRYRVISGRRRLAAAVAAGLQEVPCLVQHVDSERAERMALASNLPATRPRPPAAIPNGQPGTTALSSELAQILSSIASSADAAVHASAISRHVTADLVKAEAVRALDLLLALRVLKDDVGMSRGPVLASEIADAVSRNGTGERRLTGTAIDLRIHLESPEALLVNGDAQLLASAVGALVAATASLVESAAMQPRSAGSHLTVSLSVSADPHGSVRFLVAQVNIDPPSAWLARPFEIAWPISSGASLLSRLQAARKIAHAHGGDIRMEPVEVGSAFVLTMPGSTWGGQNPQATARTTRGSAS